MLNFTFPNTSQVGQFLYGQLGLESGSTAVITNGRVSFIWVASDELKYILNFDCTYLFWEVHYLLFTQNITVFATYSF